MNINYSTTKLPTAATKSAASDGENWSNESRITADDGSSATLSFAFGGSSGAIITGTTFDFSGIPDFAVIDGLELTIDGSQTGCYGTVNLGGIGASSKTMVSLAQTYGSSTDLWGLSSLDVGDLTSITGSVDLSDVSGGDGTAGIDYLSITVHWHISIDAPESDVPTRVDYKIFSRDGVFLGLLPNVISDLKFAQDKNTAGSTMEVKSAQDLRDVTEVDVLLAEDDTPILTESGIEILTEETMIFVTTGDNVDYAIFKNSNRVEAWLHNYYYPNGKLMFKGQVNKITFSYGGDGDAVNMLVYSDGFDLANYIARGLPPTYTLDVDATSVGSGGIVTVDGIAPGWDRYGQTWRTGASATNAGKQMVVLNGTATVTLSIYDSPNGLLLGSATKSVANGGYSSVYFEFSPLIDLSANTDYFMALSVGTNQSINVLVNTNNQYANGTMYVSNYAGAGGGSYVATTGDFIFETYYGTLTTTATFTSDDPVTDMASDVLADYNDRGGLITENDFTATGLSLTYTFILSSVYEVLKKVIELSPNGYYFYVDLGLAKIDILPINTNADFTIVNGKDIHQLDVSMSIEGVKNQLLLTGGDTGGGTNLYRSYLDSESSARYGLRTEAKTDNRVTLSATADAIGETFIEELSEETQETRITILNKTIDITLLTPGKTIGFRNFGNFIDGFVLEIVRREYTPDAVVLTLGRLPINLSTQVQAINRGLLNEQTIANPSSPS